MPEPGRVIATPYKIRIMGQERQLGIATWADGLGDPIYTIVVLWGDWGFSTYIDHSGLKKRGQHFRTFPEARAYCDKTFGGKND